MSTPHPSATENSAGTAAPSETAESADAANQTDVTASADASTEAPENPSTTAETLPDFEMVGLKVEFGDGLPDYLFNAETTGGVEPVLHFKVPENCVYHTTFNFIVRNRPLTKLKYKQVVKRAGIPFRTRIVEIGPEFAPNDPLSDTPHHSVKLPGEETPGGFLIRGHYAAHSTYYEGDDEREILFKEWSLEIVKRKALA